MPSAAAARASWRTGGYTVFLRANGNLGLWKNGVGQVVADVPTGTDPVLHPVRLTVLKCGAGIEVYVDDDPFPAILWTDYASPSFSGAFGLATELTTGTFTDVSYSGSS